MSKVTLYVKDEQVIRRAKTLAERQGCSVSAMVEQFLTSWTSASRQREPLRAPLLRQLQARLRGVKVDEREYDLYREKKYG